MGRDKRHHTMMKDSFSLLNEMLKRNSPLMLIKNVTNIYPKAVYEIDSYGQLPLHHAIQNAVSPEVIEHLLQLHKNAANAMNNQGYVPLHLLFDERTSISIDRHGYMKESYLLKVMKVFCTINPCALLQEDMDKRNALEHMIENEYDVVFVQKVQELTEGAMRLTAS